ncbi:MAG: 4-hydroxythreonine-4-phosphate dehydrogenase PdxA [Betaproteobacteria bacterium RIFCSPLOWO2_12_FULL_63_13]|nr:MAG: 4-hydroxythreonine-4-phosphate dehydrogenase PdxA [Betaproteobacteria bacterium RIFCSPLOWO2_02_FULL_63_19]OGA43188.1 MAG: 4-hydroxythreonine-4-phosphate dehydrogenase PdxA [Betaproteobacteria bacterium RIFCSPLOWO2_12_FULL_63_13]
MSRGDGAGAPGPGAAPHPVIAVTSGEPAGIGPDICLALAGHVFPGRLVILGDRETLEERKRMLNLRHAIAEFDARRAHEPGAIEVLHLPLARPCRPGVLDPANGRYVLSVLERAIDGCMSGEFAAMVTAPVHKGVINDAGIAFTGHTEFLAERTRTEQVVMMLVGGGMRVALASTHLALRDVPRVITPPVLERVLRVLRDAFARYYGISNPRFLVAGLNPHSGEGGHLGREELEVIIPVLDRMRREGFRLRGPLPADTLFTPANLEHADCVLAMYHDQGLPVLKYASFGTGINVTLGLPIIRTSVDHGTALELAGTGRAESSSLCAAVAAALQMVDARAASDAR